PLVKDTVQIAEKFRAAVMSVFNRCCAGRDEAARYLRSDADRHASPTFSGKDKDGHILASNAHAYFLPMPDRTDPRYVRKVIVYARVGFEPLEVAALRKTQVEERRGNNKLLWCSRLIGLDDNPSRDLHLRGPSSTWISFTPFIAHRHAKRRGSMRDIPENTDDPRGSFLALAAREICQTRGLPPLLDATPVTAAKNQLQFYEFRRARRKPGNDAYTRTTGYLRLTFEMPITGPLCLGYNNHFGMGLFAATDK
ncbi:MAG TPA: type I-U CRISPR-associated protein Csb2, partial [Phycisphaerae bacterium]|nr:type I-U CRISPR-associated protein Csb2 [Phycisphaerae bacterium]